MYQKFNPSPFYLENSAEFWKTANYMSNQFKRDLFWLKKYLTTRYIWWTARRSNWKIWHREVNLVTYHCEDKFADITLVFFFVVVVLITWNTCICIWWWNFETVLYNKMQANVKWHLAEKYAHIIHLNS